MSSTNLSKTDSEVSSLANSSPARPGHVYFVQSPSRDSHDGEKTTNSFHSTPVLSPMGSPPHSSRESSSARLSSLRSSKNGRHKASAPGGRRPWKRFDSIEEEGLLGGVPEDNGSSRRWYIIAFVVGFTVLFSSFSLILWGASRPQEPKIIMRSILFDQFVVQGGSDGSGVATSMVSMNSTVRFNFHNTASFFGVHVSSTPLELSYLQLTLATGSMGKFYQSRKSQRSIAVTVRGSHIPVYGGGAGLISENRAPVQPVQLTLKFKVRSRAFVLGKLVKPKFYKEIACLVTIDPNKMSVRISLKNKCNFQ